MPKNIERILEEPSNRKEEKTLELEHDHALKGFFWNGQTLKEIDEKLHHLKDIDKEQALALNEEFDRLVENGQKKAEELQKAQEEFEEFIKRLNAKVEEKEK